MLTAVVCSGTLGPTLRRAQIASDLSGFGGERNNEGRVVGLTKQAWFVVELTGRDASRQRRHSKRMVEPKTVPRVAEPAVFAYAGVP